MTQLDLTARAPRGTDSTKLIYTVSNVWVPAGKGNRLAFDINVRNSTRKKNQAKYDWARATRAQVREDFGVVESICRSIHESGLRRRRIHYFGVVRKSPRRRRTSLCKRITFSHSFLLTQLVALFR